MALSPFKLPKLQGRMPIVDSKGLPTSAFVRYWNIDFIGAIEGAVNDIVQVQQELIAVNERQDETDANLQDQIDRLTAILAGTGETFTGLSVGGTNVKPFLDNTDGAQLTNSAGLGTSVVETVKVAPNAITNYVGAYTSASLTLGGTTPVTIQTVTFTTTGGPMEIKANFFMNIYHPAGGGVDARIRIVQASPFGSNLFDETFSAVGDDFFQGWQTPTVTITRAAGTYMFDLIVSLSNNTSALEIVQSRLLSAQEFKR